MGSVRTASRAIIQRDGKLLVIRYHVEHGDHYALPGGSQRRAAARAVDEFLMGSSDLPAPGMA
jgi:ADP-ribose pyrophosphatase YjhB (NUDIX family)